jgi:nicotinamidase-related amidase
MTETLLQPADCLFLFVDYQAGLAFGVESIARQAILNNAVSLARTAMVFNAPIVASTSASKVYSGPLLPSLQAVMPSVQPIERRNMNAWEDDKARGAIRGNQSEAADCRRSAHRSLRHLSRPVRPQRRLRGIRCWGRLRRP